MKSARERDQKKNNYSGSIYYETNSDEREEEISALIELNRKRNENTSSKYNYVKPSGMHGYNSNLDKNFSICQNFNYDADNSCCRLGQCALITLVALGIIPFIISIILIFHMASHEDNYIRAALWFPIVSASLILFVACCIPIICLCFGLFMNNIVK